MEIDVIYKGELEPDKVIATNEKEEIKVKLPKEELEEKEFEEVPVIRGGYYVDYDLNLPSGCTSEEKQSLQKKSYFAYEKAEIPKDSYTCSGWQFKGWKLPVGTTTLGDDRFIMPPNDITVTAVWTKIELSKGID